MPGFPENVRVFTAVDLAAPIRARVHGAAQRLLRGLGKLSSPPEENLHITLKFIGEVHRDEIPALSEAVADGAGRLRPGTLTVQGFGAFPGLHRPRVVWAGVSDPSGILTPVHDRLNRTLTAFGAKHEKKRFAPHITVARVRSAFDAEELLARLTEAKEMSFGTQSVRAIALYMSEMRKGMPPRHTVLGHYEAGGGSGA